MMNTCRRRSLRAAVIRTGLVAGFSACFLIGSGGAQDLVRDVEQVPAVDRPQQEHGAQPRESGVQSVPSIQALTVVGTQTVFAGSFGLGVFRSDDRGESWSPANAGLTDPFVLCLATAKDGTVYAGTFRAGVFRSEDGGKSWHAINAGLKRLEIKTLLLEGGVIYAGTGDGVYRRSGTDSQWMVVTKGLDETLVHALAKGADGTLFAGTSGKGVMRYKATGSEWKRLSHGLVDHEGLGENFIRVLVMDKVQGLYAGTFDGGVFRSGDGGQTWRPISRALPNDSIRGIVASERGLFVATGRGIFKSLNQGRQWIALNHGLTELSVQVLIASGGGSLYAGTSSGVFRSDDDGMNWVAISEGLQGVSESPFK
ncbi:MAG: ligand-binding sensor domain-containing protein [Nitrospiraceae bacterium]